MSFLFASSHLPAVKRPQDADEEEEPSEARQTAKGSPKGERSESTQAQPMQRSGGVRAISHLEEPVRRGSSMPLSQRGAQATGHQVRAEKPAGPDIPPADGVAAAKASGIFDVVRHQYNQGGNEHFMDEDGQLRPRNESRRWPPLPPQPNPLPGLMNRKLMPITILMAMLITATATMNLLRSQASHDAAQTSQTPDFGRSLQCLVERSRNAVSNSPP